MICLGMHGNVMLRFMVQAFRIHRYVAAPFFCMVNGDDITTNGAQVLHHKRRSWMVSNA